MAEQDLCVARVPIFQGLTRQEQLAVAEFARPVLVPKGETVYSAGQPAPRLLVMHSGRIKISHVSVNGQEQIVGTAVAGDVVGERAFLTGHLPEHFAVAVEDCEICVFDHADLSTLLRTYPDIGKRMLRALSDRLNSAERLLAAVTSSDVTARVAAYLLDLPGSVQDGLPTVRLPMTKKDVASYLGTTPETLSRRLAAFVDAGVITLRGRRDITVLDAPALERAAASD